VRLPIQRARRDPRRHSLEERVHVGRGERLDCGFLLTRSVSEGGLELRGRPSGRIRVCPPECLSKRAIAVADGSSLNPVRIRPAAFVTNPVTKQTGQRACERPATGSSDSCVIDRCAEYPITPLGRDRGRYLRSRRGGAVRLSPPWAKFAQVSSLHVVDLLPGAVPGGKDRIVRVLPRRSESAPEHGDGEAGSTTDLMLASDFGLGFR
jgi:hypothetical protein